MMGSIKTKRATLEIVAIKPISNKNDRSHYRDIQTYKHELKNALLANNQAHAELYRNEIKKKRVLLRKLRPQMYTFKVTLNRFPKWKQKVDMLFDTERGRKEFMKFLKSAEDEALRRIRMNFKYEPQDGVWNKTSLCKRAGTKEKGFVFVDDGTILKAHVKKNMKMLLAGKIPAAPRRYVGIELEFCAPIREEQLALKLFQNGIHKFGQLKEDGSLRPRDKESSFELALLLEESNYKKGLKAVTKILHEVKAVAKERRCGLHVHLDMRRRNKDLVYNNLVACQYALLSVVDPNRYNNEFCRVVKSRKFPTEFTGDRVERYKTINAAAYYKYRTLEVRMHEGSVSFDEISHWVDLLLKVANYSKFLKNDVTKLPVLKTRLKLQKKLYNYALERSCSWQIQANPNHRHMREDVADLLARPARRQPQQIRFEAPAQDNINIVANHDVAQNQGFVLGNNEHFAVNANGNLVLRDGPAVGVQVAPNEVPDDDALRRFMNEQAELAEMDIDFGADLEENQVDGD